MDKIKDIISKLLNRTTANGCTEGEAAVALAKARNLLAKYNLSVQDLDSDENSIEELKVETDTKTLSLTQAYIALALKDHFGVEIVNSGNSHSSCLKIVAEKFKAEIFKEAFLFAYNSFKSNWSRYSKTLACSTQEKTFHRGTYLKGYCDGITNELSLQENATALVVVKSKELSDYMSSMEFNGHTRFSNKVSKSDEVYNQGYKTGAFVQRNKNKSIA